jgi:hypothetical protein
MEFTNMAKFYVQSGTLKLVVHAVEADRAALWAVHKVLLQVLPVFDDQELSPQEKQVVVAFHGAQVLDEKIRLSELGFDRDDAEAFDTAEIITEWAQLVMALSRIEQTAPVDEEEDMLLAVG